MSLGFHADLNETIPVGKIDAESEKLIRVTQECLTAAIAICKPGALFRDIGKVMYVFLPHPNCSSSLHEVNGRWVRPDIVVLVSPLQLPLGVRLLDRMWDME